MMQRIVTPKRFRELTGDRPIEVLPEPLAFKIYSHLVDLNDYYSDFVNIAIAAMEGNQIEPVTNPRVLADLVVPQLIDRLSRETWRNEPPSVI